MIFVKSIRINNHEEFIQLIEHKIQPERLTTEDKLALITCVGRKMKTQPGVSGKIFSAMGKSNINIRTIAQGTDEMSILVGVDNSDFEDSLHVLYEQFIG